MFRFAVLMADCRGARESWHVFVLNDSVIQGSLNNRFGHTPDSSGLKLKFVKKNLLLVLSSVENLRKVKLKEFVRYKLIFPPSTCVILFCRD